VPFDYDETKAAHLRVPLKAILERIEQVAFGLKR
jgi:hypothetical protein